jgi:hypothetical protein
VRLFLCQFERFLRERLLSDTERCSWNQHSSLSPRNLGRNFPNARGIFDWFILVGNPFTLSFFIGFNVRDPADVWNSVTTVPQEHQARSFNLGSS